jgi:hypothetical protein
MRPRRTIVVCSWDGEEVGLTGSTEWGEQFADELRSKAVAYINVDEATSGPNFHGQAVASLAPMLVETDSLVRRSLRQNSLRRVERNSLLASGAKANQSSQFSSSGSSTTVSLTPASAVAPTTRFF